MNDDLNRTIEITVDKFIFRFPVNLRYSDAGLWIRQEGSLLRIGMADFAQQRNGDIAFATLAPSGSIDFEEEIAAIETVKVNISLPSPVKGTILETNSELDQSPELINQEPYGRGWLALVQPENLESDLGKLMTAEAYSKLARQQAETELKA